MIPYFMSPRLALGPVNIELFGVFSALGIYLTTTIGIKRAVARGLQTKILADYAFWGVLCGVVFGHFVHLFAYHPEELAKPYQIFKLWDGLSSFGGLLGGVIAAVILFRVKKLDLMEYGDVAAPPIAMGWAIARVGCFTVHDHVGVLTSFPLAVAFPNGARHDLGLYDAFLLAAIAAILFAASRRGMFKHRLLALMAVLYAPGRFLFDFLRAEDVPYHDARYYGLTPGQYFCFVLAAWGLYMLARPVKPATAELSPRPPQRAAA
ncbi:MAG TPA: prolipoprotein diacylglyceryl transferase family protein [Myxococcales bacterium]|jgi:phosphatidylglycerol:prolipoprotein diacylglycerol transferase